MNHIVCGSKEECGQKAAEIGVSLISECLKRKDSCTIVLATGASQFELLNNLTSSNAIDWSKVDCFHLDEYIGLEDTHPASFRNYLTERFLKKLKTPVKSFEFIIGDAKDPLQECKRLNELISKKTVDVAFIGIGENGHLAFNDPPFADVDTEDPFIIVQLAEDCRKQQLGEGWFKSMDEIPTQAISMSLKQILKSEYIVCTVPEQRKATAVKNAVKGPVDGKNCPASLLRLHKGTNNQNCVHLILDKDSASLLDEVTK